MINWPLTWTMLTAILTGIMAIAVAVASYFAFKNWNKSLIKDKQDIAGKLFVEFSNNSEITTGMHYLSRSEFKNSIFESNAEEIIGFFAKLGKLLKEDIISLEDIKIHFYNYLFYEKRMLIIINNLKTLFPEIPDYYLENFDYLMNRISDLHNIKCYKNIINNSFSPSSELSFSPSQSPSASPSTSPSSSPEED